MERICRRCKYHKQYWNIINGEYVDDGCVCEKENCKNHFSCCYCVGEECPDFEQRGEHDEENIVD